MRLKFFNDVRLLSTDVTISIKYKTYTNAFLKVRRLINDILGKCL